MELNLKLFVLDRLYDVYDSFSQTLDLACRKHCAHCCTTNVTLTTLEGYHLGRHLKASGQVDIIGKLMEKSSLKRFQPRFTINQMANWCREGKDIPPEAPHQFRTPCPVLNNNACPVYTARPFGCRCFCSVSRCSEHNIAEVDPFVISVNDVFLQYIEHIDSGGYTGNLIDVMTYLETSGPQKDYRRDSRTAAPPPFDPEPFYEGSDDSAGASGPPAADPESDSGYKSAPSQIK